MTETFYKIHVYGIQIILNCIPLLWINIFYDNMTYIGNTLRHPFYLFLWTLSSVLGFYIYSKKIWEHYQVSFSKKIHTTFCLGMLVSSTIPYAFNTIFKDLHVWLTILFVCGFLFEWLFYIPISLNKNSILFFANIGLSLLFTFIFGHITGFCEIYFSVTTNIILLRWMLSNS